ncbi:BPL-N domain-containing protein [Desulfonatronovibrio hydrogenovorans]|uniref:BPL-N domain-containing protein n=1 Tax=Desulfonatronovibrio hydrogenovorans TaxID=53245 RepID=UPI00048F7FC4|nr:BPL-N domain-containing protein [Desulfonatronovibrio hydrogenovorans]
MSDSQGFFYLLWDESHLWGVMLWQALAQMGTPLKIVDASEIRSGILDHAPPAGLLVPGGWARLKAERLGKSGLQNIRDYVDSGGKYLGFCGGAGLALKSTSRTSCLDLCSWQRKPFKERLPNFSGHVLCRVTGLNLDQKQELFLPVWWPSQFEPCPEDQSVKILASYLRPGQDFWSSDLNLSLVDPADLKKWESVYGINLDPALLTQEPCIIMGDYGQGKYILSYSHLETPGSSPANSLLQDILEQWLGRSLKGKTSRPLSWDLKNTVPAWNHPVLVRSRQGLDQVIELGKSQFLLFWRNSWLLGWRRGIPGSPINFLYALSCQAMSRLPSPQAAEFWETAADQFDLEMNGFVAELKEYLGHERLALTMSQSSPEASSDGLLQKQKTDLFGSFPGYGGRYGRLIRDLDRLVYLTLAEKPSR